jgi:glycosyltransferase involved in cell wall biosynthesis
VGIEAMAHEKPVIAFDVGGISDWLKDGVNGFLVRPGDHQELAEKIKFLLDKPDIAKEMGKNGREMVSEVFAPGLHLERLVSVFQQAINSFSRNH